MARFSILLAPVICSLIYFVSAGPLIGSLVARQGGCGADGSTTTDSTGQTYQCGGDGNWYNNQGAIATPNGQSGSSSGSGSTAVQQPGSSDTSGSSGSTSTPGSSGTGSGGQCSSQGQTTTDSTCQTYTCGGDGNWYNSQGALATPNGPPGASCGGSGSSGNGSGGDNGSSGSGSATGVQQPASSATGGAATGQSTGAASSGDLSSAPAGWQTGFSTQDTEPAGQQSGCSTNCPSHTFITGNSQIGPGGALAAAANPAMFGGDGCAVCGKCFNVMNAGVAASDGPGGPSPQVAAGQQIKIWLVNTCTNCAMDQFDINNSPSGWDNPKIYYQAIDC